MAPCLFLDSADTATWAELWPLGLFRGITTNPSLIRRSGRACTIEDLRSLVEAAREQGCDELHLQAWGATPGELLARGRALGALDPHRVVIKLPLTEPGLRAARQLCSEHQRVTLTACHAAHQVLAAAALGVSYVAPYLGRISDGGGDGLAEVRMMARCLQGLGASTRLLVASLRSVAEITQLAAAGVDTFTLSPRLAHQLWTHPATTAAAEQFEAEAEADGPSQPPAISERDSPPG